MPSCKFFIQGLCTRDPCPYRHVHVNSEAEVCPGIDLMKWTINQIIFVFDFYFEDNFLFRDVLYFYKEYKSHEFDLLIISPWLKK